MTDTDPDDLGIWLGNAYNAGYVEGDKQGWKRAVDDILGDHIDSVRIKYAVALAENARLRAAVEEARRVLTSGAPAATRLMDLRTALTDAAPHD